MIPVCESKLTHLFEDFFCGKDRASSVINISRSMSVFNKTLQVLFCWCPSHQWPTQKTIHSADGEPVMRGLDKLSFPP